MPGLRTHQAIASDIAAAKPPLTALDPRPLHQERGEGIGLSIVKRLSELLDATMELASTPNVGTVIRVIFPRHYDSV